VDTSRKLQASKVIDAPPDVIFALLADPGRHADLDAAGTVRGPAGVSPPIGGIGQVFTMSMHADDLGDYRMVNAVTAYQPVSRIGWAPRLDPTCGLAEEMAGVEVGGHTFTYDLREVDGGTEVTETYEWMSVKDERFLQFFPRISQEQMEGTLDRIAAAVA
jgi:hypothetical protein